MAWSITSEVTANPGGTAQLSARRLRLAAFPPTSEGSLHRGSPSQKIAAWPCSLDVSLCILLKPLLLARIAAVEEMSISSAARKGYSLD